MKTTATGTEAATILKKITKPILVHVMGQNDPLWIRAYKNDLIEQLSGGTGLWDLEEREDFVFVSRSSQYNY